MWCVMAVQTGFAIAKFECHENANAFIVDSLKLIDWDELLADLPTITPLNSEKICSLVKLNEGTMLIVE